MRLRRAKRLRFLSLAVVLAVALAACGDGRDDDEGAGTDDTTEDTGDDGADGAGFAIDTADCVTDPSSVTIEGDTIKLGTSLPQSGQYAAFNNINLGQQAYFRYVNDELGGIDVGGKKYKVELVATNDEYAADKTVANVTSLVEDDDVFALFNVVGTKNNLAIRDYVNENCVPNLFAATGSPAWGNREYPWLIGTFLVPYPLEMQALVTYLAETKPDAKIAILRANDDFGRSYSETLESLIEGTDLTIVAEETYDPESTEVASQVTSLASSGADVWVLGATLAPVPVRPEQRGGGRLEADDVHVGHVHVEDADGHRRCERRRRDQRRAADGPERPAVGAERGDDALQGEDRRVRRGCRPGQRDRRLRLDGRGPLRGADEPGGGADAPRRHGGGA
ncbi:MAG: hypothetical protein KatS3mg010_1911 [Acidimicrobiia bacterium]|nr:MAG: hypothetical protein KatS3mg010_1911 [Acidimicrobiia bacterium]